MTRKELIAHDRWLTENKWGSSEIVTPEQAADLYLAEHPLPSAEGAEAILKEGLDDGRYADIVDGINIDVKQPFYQAIIRYAEDVVAAQQQPTAEGAEEIDDETIAWAAEHQCGTPFSERWIGFVKGAKWHRSLHAQRIADKMVSERMKKVESLLNMAAGLVGNPCTNISSSCDIACDDWQGEYNEYLKSREK